MNADAGHVKGMTLLQMSILHVSTSLALRSTHFFGLIGALRLSRRHGRSESFADIGPLAVL